MPIIVPPSSQTTRSTLVNGSTLVNDVIPHVPLCPVFEIENQLRFVSREFCRRSCIWRSRNQTLLTTVVDEDEYAATVPGDGELNAVHTAWDGDTELEVELPG